MGNNLSKASVSESYFCYTRSEMLKFIPSDVCKVLEIGCAEGAFGQLLKDSRKVEVWGVEISESAANKARLKLDHVVIGDFENDKLNIPTSYFDCVIFNDVLEHFRYPWAVLKKTLEYLKKDGCVVASIPNVRYFENLKNIVLHKKWEYVESGIMDKTHLRFFTEKSICNMFKRCGYDIVRIEGIRSERFPWKIGLLNRLLFNALDDTKFQQFACVAHRKKSADL